MKEREKESLGIPWTKGKQKKKNEWVLPKERWGGGRKAFPIKRKVCGWCDGVEIDMDVRGVGGWGDRKGGQNRTHTLEGAPAWALHHVVHLFFFLSTAAHVVLWRKDLNEEVFEWKGGEGGGGVRKGEEERRKKRGRAPLFF
eukprot:Sspe_Gene.109412::Locus_89547_Transcript_1_1_Confidence_1.000_Length_547::g.109412::m.109412